MVITWRGEGCFKIQSGDFILISDPIGKISGKTDILLKTLADWPASSSVENEAGREIFGPGHYEIKGADIQGWLLENESEAKFIKTVYLAEIDEIKLVFLGHISDKLDPVVEEKIKAADVLFIPIGGKPYLDSAEAAKISRALTPKIIIPSFFKIPGLKRQAETAQPFLKALNQSSVKAEEKLILKKKELADVKLKIVILNP